MSPFRRLMTKMTLARPRPIMQDKLRVATLICAFWCVLLMFRYGGYEMRWKRREPTSRLEINNLSTNRDKDIPLILFWTKYFETSPLEGTDILHRLEECEEKDNFTCYVTEDRNLLPQADAVIFHYRDLERKDLPKYHLPSQLWVYMNQESPFHIDLGSLTNFKDMFNLTMSYKRFSDILHPYRSIVKRRFSMSSEELQIHVDAALKKKESLIAWVVSNCEASNRRAEIVRELKIHIAVHTYGSCGDLGKCTGGGGCLGGSVGDKHKFHLSFENSNCVDYVTEKAFNPLKYFVVPLVYGGGEYEAILPPHSFIDIKKFDRLEELASFLKDMTDEEYRKYFDWKKDYVVGTGPGYCNLCKRMHAVKAELKNNKGVLPEVMMRDPYEFEMFNNQTRYKTPEFLRQHKFKISVPDIPACNLFV